MITSGGGRYVAYYRVSTGQQSESGLGLESQQAQVRDYVAANHGCLVGEYSETVSGRKNDRPQLATALTTCRITGAVLVIARLDRLSRNVAKRKPKSRFGHRREATPAHARLINGPVSLDKKSTEC